MVKLDYTSEMKQQDELWENEKENLDTMEKLFKEIIEQAKCFGFKGVYVIYQANNECICEIYDDEEEYERCCNGDDDTGFIFGYCKPLIKCLEDYYLNKN